MAHLLISFFNLIIGFLSMFPTDSLDIDLQPIVSFLPFLNYYVPFYLVAPILMKWLGLLVGLTAVVIGKGFVIRHF